MPEKHICLFCRAFGKKELEISQNATFAELNHVNERLQGKNELQ